MAESQYLALCTGERVVHGVEQNYRVACSIAERCARYMQPEEPWHDKRTIMCWGDLDNFVRWEGRL